jgi:hypothetical protein
MGEGQSIHGLTTKRCCQCAVSRNTKVYWCRIDTELTAYGRSSQCSIEREKVGISFHLSFSFAHTNVTFLYIVFQ